MGHHRVHARLRRAAAARRAGRRPVRPQTRLPHRACRCSPLASLGAALAGSPAALIVARVGQGVGAAMLSPAALSLVTTLYDEGPARSRALAAWAAVAASAARSACLLGGALTSVLDWPAIFLINLPAGGRGPSSLARRILPAGRGAPAGASTCSARCSPPVRSWHSSSGSSMRRTPAGARLQTLGLLAVALLGLAAFALVESRVPAPLPAAARPAAPPDRRRTGPDGRRHGHGHVVVLLPHHVPPGGPRPLRTAHRAGVPSRARSCWSSRRTSASTWSHATAPSPCSRAG